MSYSEKISSVSAAAAQRIIPRIEESAEISESPNFLSRRFGSKEHQQVNDLVASWMMSAGMETRQDAIGNIIGRYPADDGIADATAILLGSHLDTVINAGRYDGMLGVLSALAVVETLHEHKLRLPHAIEIVGFADEEGVRYQSTYLGSRAMTGHFDNSVIDRADSDGVSFTKALEAFGSSIALLPSAVRNASELRAYLEVHIEQGPVLEAKDQAVGVVSSIAGANRLIVTLTGLAGHAGTVPMGLRQDALVAAAQCISLIESICSNHEGLVGTVGMIDAKPGASNVIAGDVQFTVDIRAAEDKVREERVAAVIDGMTSICQQRDIAISIDRVHEAISVDCDSGIMVAMRKAMKSQGMDELILPSGAGHDAAAMADMTHMGMLFVRCTGGISHHPDEHVTEADAIAGANTLLLTVLNLCAAAS